MRTFVLLLLLILCGSYADAHQFIFKNGKSVQGTILFEDASLYRIMDLSGVEMRLRKSELNLDATQAANVLTEALVPAPVLPTETAASETTRRPTHVYSNRDVQVSNPVASAPADPESESAWRKHISKLEHDFARLQNECRGAGAGPNLSKIRRTEAYKVNGKTVHITGYWADPANIESAKNICRRALQTEKALNDARLQFSEFQTERRSTPGR